MFTKKKVERKSFSSYVELTSFFSAFESSVMEKKVKVLVWETEKEFYNEFKRG